MSELVYDLNTAIVATIDWDTVSGGVIPDFIPLIGYEDTTAPFVLYSIIPRIVSAEKYYQSRDYIRYYVYDNDIDRMWAISRAIRDVLNVASDEGLDTLKSNIPVDSEFRLLYSILRSAVTLSPIEREGFSNTNNEFEVSYVRL